MIKGASVFEFGQPSLHPSSGEVLLPYRFDHAPWMVERLWLPLPAQWPASRAQAIERALIWLHLVAGVSYYKAWCPPQLKSVQALPSAYTGALETVWREGLREFAYRNGLELDSRIALAAERLAFAPAPDVGLSSGPLVAIGGGKDSLVCIEALRAAGAEPTLAYVGSSELIEACALATGLPTLNVRRQIDPQLLALNRQGAYNGHVPVTAINSAILVLLALLHGHRAVVFANERSADEPTCIDGKGRAVNHQWSKSLAFESLYDELVQQCIAADLRYLSLLRPLGELAVIARFAALEAYFDCYSSCNRNFVLFGQRPEQRWCGQCPKCHFVFLGLAPFLPKPRLVAIFGRNLLDEADQAPGFDALLGLGDGKPFECVGEARESAAAMVALCDRADWRSDAVVARFARQIRPQLGQIPSLSALLAERGPHRLPPAWAGLWDA